MSNSVRTRWLINIGLPLLGIAIFLPSLLAYLEAGRHLTPYSVSVSGYFRRNGTYVRPHHRRPPGSVAHDAPYQRMRDYCEWGMLLGIGTGALPIVRFLYKRHQAKGGNALVGQQSLEAPRNEPTTSQEPRIGGERNIGRPHEPDDTTPVTNSDVRSTPEAKTEERVEPTTPPPSESIPNRSNADDTLPITQIGAIPNTPPVDRVPVKRTKKAASLPCERCGENPRVRKERFCKECRKIVLEELAESGYFSTNPSRPPSEEKGRKTLRSSEWLSHQIHEDDYSEESRHFSLIPSALGG